MGGESEVSLWIESQGESVGGESEVSVGGGVRGESGWTGGE